MGDQSSRPDAQCLTRIIAQRDKLTSDFTFKQKRESEMLRGMVGSERCIRDMGGRGGLGGMGGRGGCNRWNGG